LKNKYKLLIILSLIVVFAIGVAAGILGEKYLVHKRYPQREGPRDRQSPHFPTIETMAKELQLTQEQQDKIREIFKRNDDRLKELRGSLHQRLEEMRTLLKGEIDGVLTAEQRQKFEAMIESYLLQRKKEFERRRGSGERERSQDKPKGETK
jgi:Spy/CpxP family protein refolding chaperone